MYPTLDHQYVYMINRFPNHPDNGTVPFFKIYMGKVIIHDILNFEFMEGYDNKLREISWLPNSFLLSEMSWFRDSDTATVPFGTLSGYSLNTMNPKKGGKFLFYKMSHSGHFHRTPNKLANAEIEADGDLYGDLKYGFFKLYQGENGDDFYALTITRQYYKRHLFSKSTFKPIAPPAGKEAIYTGKKFDKVCGTPEHFPRPLFHNENFAIIGFHKF